MQGPSATPQRPTSRRTTSTTWPARPEGGPGMTRPTSRQWRQEGLILLAALVVAFALPPFFDTSSINVLSFVFLALVVGTRVWEYAKPRREELGTTEV